MAAASLALTENTATVGASLLGAGVGVGEGQGRGLDLARSSFKLARRRLYEAGALVDRYVPAPGAVGTSRVGFVVTRPFTDQMPVVIHDLERLPGSVLVLSGEQVAFAVVFHASERSAHDLDAQVAAGQFGAPVVSLVSDPTQPSVPVYFDFEGAWAHLVGLEGTRRYPHPLPTAHVGAGAGGAPLQALLQRPFEAAARPAHLGGPSRLPRSQRRMLDRGFAEWRVLLNPEVGISYQDLAVSHLVLTRGRLRAGRDLPGLFRTLVGDCGVFPFLLASDGATFLLGCLGISLEAMGRAPPKVRPRSPVFPAIAYHADALAVIREPVAGLRVHLHHRYDRLVPGADARGASGRPGRGPDP